MKSPRSRLLPGRKPGMLRRWTDRKLAWWVALGLLAWAIFLSPFIL